MTASGGAPADTQHDEVPRLTEEQAAIIGAFTGTLCGSFSVMHAYIERIMGRPVFTHEMGSGATMDLVKEKARAHFLALCAVASGE